MDSWFIARAQPDCSHTAVSEFAADAILIVHFAFVSFVIGGLALTWLGIALHWRWVRNIWFRLTHVAAICFVATEALLGMMCPLTLWEDALRGASNDSGFIERWIHRMMFYHFPEWIFTLAYVAFALAVLLTYWLMPPTRAPRSKKRAR